VNATVAAGFEKSGEAHFLEQRTQGDGRGNSIVEVGAGLRVEINPKLVGIIRVAGERGPRVENDGVHLYGPHGGSRFVEDNLRVRPAARVGHGNRSNVVRRSLGRIL
jgi:hypothetical protein